MQKLPDGYSKQQVLDAIKFEAEYSAQKVDRKRQEIVNNYKNFHNRGDDFKIYDTTIKTMTKIVKSIHAKQKREVDIDIAGATDRSDADMIEALLDDVFAKNQKGRKNKMKIENMCIAGPGIEVQQYNHRSGRVEYMLMNPLTWLPDYDFDINYGFKYHGFQLEANKEELEYGGYFNLDNIKSVFEEKLDKLIDQKVGKGGNRNSAMQLQEVKDYVAKGSYQEKNTYSIHLHYRRFNGLFYAITTDYSFSEIIGIEEFTPVTALQKRNPYEVDCPVTITWLLENPFDPFGDSLFTIAGNDQKMRQLFLNLNLQKARQEAGNDYYFVDPRSIENPQDLTNPNENGPTFLWLSNTRTDNNPVREMPRAQIKPDSYNMPAMLQDKMFYQIGYDESSAGVVTEQTTATQQVRAQKNANNITAFNETYIADGEEDFYKKCLEMYARYGEGYLEITYGVSGTYKKGTFSPKKLKRLLNKIIITARSRKIASKEESKQFYMLYGQQLLGQAKTDFERYMINRNIMEAYERPQYIIDQELNEPIEYVKAKMDVELINNGEKIEIDDMNEDHLAYLTIYREADEGPAKWDAINKRMMAYLQSNQKQSQQPMQQGGMGLSNVAQNAMVQKQVGGTNAPSLQDLQVA